MTDIVLLRHGEVHNPTKVLYGRRPGFRLSEAGRAQAQAAGQALADVALAAWFSSPLQRAQETAALALAAHPQAQHLSISTDERLIEISTPYEGAPLAELEKIAFEVYRPRQAGQERVRDVWARLLDFLAAQRAAYAGQTIAAVTHGDLVVCAFLYAVGEDGDDIGRGRLHSLGLPEAYPATASILRLRYTSDDPAERPQWSYTRPY